MGPFMYCRNRQIQVHFYKNLSNTQVSISNTGSKRTAPTKLCNPAKIIWGAISIQAFANTANTWRKAFTASKSWKLAKSTSHWQEGRTEGNGFNTQWTMSVSGPATKSMLGNGGHSMKAQVKYIRSQFPLPLTLATCVKPLLRIYIFVQFTEDAFFFVCWRHAYFFLVRWRNAFFIFYFFLVRRRCILLCLLEACIFFSLFIKDMHVFSLFAEEMQVCIVRCWQADQILFVEY